MGPQRIRRGWLLALIGTVFICGCSGIIGSGGNEAVDDAVAKELCVVDTPIRRLTRFEYNNTVRDLLGDNSNPADVLPPEEEVAGFNNQAGALTTSDLLVEQYLKVAEGVSARAIGNMDALMEGCDPASQGSDAAHSSKRRSTGFKTCSIGRSPIPISVRSKTAFRS
jgi:hypothetical protein